MRYIIRQGLYKSSEIVVLTPYAGQLRKLQRTLSISFKVILGQVDKVKRASARAEEMAPKLQNSHLPYQRRDSEQSMQRKPTVVYSRLRNVGNSLRTRKSRIVLDNLYSRWRRTCTSHVHRAVLCKSLHRALGAPGHINQQDMSQDHQEINPFHQ
jgi:hypothetical protein